MTETSPITEGLLMIHKIISRGLSNAIKRCNEYEKNNGIPPGEIRGFTMYVTTLKNVTHSHHLAEDEIMFPWYRGKLDAPFDRLDTDHKAITGLLDELDRSLKEIPASGTAQVGKILNLIEELWIPHIATEEEFFTPTRVKDLTSAEEQKMLVAKVSEHGMKTSGPGPMTLPFVIYTLEGKEREAMLSDLPMVVRRIFVPVVWRNKWKPMKIFFNS